MTDIAVALYHYTHLRMDNTSLVLDIDEGTVIPDFLHRLPVMPKKICRTAVLIATLQMTEVLHHRAAEDFHCLLAIIRQDFPALHR